jgi:hypothetical protein
MGGCCGVLGWPPDAFWSASLRDVINAIRAWNRANSPKGKSAPPQPMRRDRLDELMAIYPDEV